LNLEYYEKPHLRVCGPGFRYNILFISYTKCIANLVSSPYFFNFSTHAQ
jgi:hypothetical protein